jgi:hypothetical protein
MSSISPSVAGRSSVSMVATRSVECPTRGARLIAGGDASTSAMYSPMLA